MGTKQMAPSRVATAPAPPTAAGTQRRLTQRGRERRAQLMEYAAQRFAEKGYHPTSVAEIVQGMEVGKGVFYWYFSSKEELFLEILKDAQTSLRRRQQSAIGDEIDPIKRIELGMRASMAWLSEHRHLYTLFQFAVSEERFATVLRRGQDVAVADVIPHVKEGMVAGRIRDVDPQVLAHAILGVTNHLARIFIFERGEPPGQVADAAVSFCLEGLLVS
ncbi:MAG TPA: TetR/AcrR family transcriptional regulator [Acidimicrobiales bacterium]|nr:TetR/AcrR family transcriptional regulator [Acidimicrobiales bacterium]